MARKKREPLKKQHRGDSAVHINEYGDDAIPNFDNGIRIQKLANGKYRAYCFSLPLYFLGDFNTEDWANDMAVAYFQDNLGWIPI